MTRTRSITEPAVVGVHRNYKNGVLQTKSANTTMSSFSSSITDVVTPNYRQKARDGIIVNNPCSMTVTRRSTSGSGSVTQVQNAAPHDVWVATGTGTITGYYDKYGGGLPNYTGAPLPDLIALGPLVKQDCIANMDPTPFSFAEDIAEFRETLRFLKNPLATTLKFAKKFSRTLKQIKSYRNLRIARQTASQLAKGVADHWLEQRFAIMPTFRTILSVMAAYEAPKVRLPERRTARSSIVIDQKIDARTMTVVSAGRTFTYSCKGVSSGSVRAGILYEVKNQITNFQYTYGLRYKDITETMWAVVPYSFVIDRFFNISNFIRGAENLLDPNVDILAAWITEKSERTTTIGVRSVLESGYASTVVPDDLIDKTFGFERTVWYPTGTDIIPPLHLRGLVDSATKTADLCALIVQNLKG